MRASEWGKPPNALRAKGAEKEEDSKDFFGDIVIDRKTRGRIFQVAQPDLQWQVLVNMTVNIRGP
jgi:hypothetical protein